MCDHFVKCRRHYFIDRIETFAIIKSRQMREFQFVFFLLFWFSSRLGGGIWVIRNPMKCALDDLNNPQEKKRGPSAESRVCVAFDLIFKTRTEKKRRRRKHTLDFYASIRRRRTFHLTCPARFRAGFSTSVYIYTCRHRCWLAGRGLTMGSSHALFLVVGGLEVLFFSLAGAILILSKSIKAHGWREE